MVWFDLINEQDPYDIVPDNSPQAHYRFMEKEIEILKVTSRVRDDIVRQERYKMLIIYSEFYVQYYQSSDI
jgi:hypothetical protein